MRAASYKAASNKILLICVLLSVLGFPLRGIAARVQPSNLPAGFCDDVVNRDFISNTTAQINSDTDCTEVVAQTQGPDLCVVRYRNITLGSSGTLGFSGTRPVALTAQGNVLIQGVVYTGAGPDSITGGVGLAFGGGGGGGGITSGGNGGSGSDAGTVNNGGLGGTAGGTRALRPLQGGRSGGAGGGNDPTPGGTGGGALALVACGSLIVTAQIDAGGRGGSGGIAETNFGAANGGGSGGGGLLLEGDSVTVSGGLSANGGSGGGGGGLLLEGDSVTVSGGLSANGGGGGGGGTRNFGPANYGQPGASGGYTSTPALGGAALDTAGAGGRGGTDAGNGFPFSGGNGQDTYGAGGGGGGAAGRIRINFCGSLSHDPLLASPVATIGISCSDLIFRDGFDPA
jgi:hypothetical protein